jgi:hypothetical protein
MRTELAEFSDVVPWCGAALKTRLRLLERPPGMRPRAVRQHLLASRNPGQVRVFTAPLRYLRVNALVRHHLVHEPEAAQRLCIRQQQLKPFGKLLADQPRIGDRLLGVCVASAARLHFWSALDSALPPGAAPNVK